jgi:hypothetical protein
MENQDSALVSGFYPKPKHANAPDFVIAKASVNLQQFAEFVKTYKAANPNEEWLNIDMKLSRAGKGYASVDTWKPDPAMQGQSSAAAPASAMASVDDDLPF